MKIRKETSPNNVFTVSNSFVEKYMNKISGDGVKLYLRILCSFEAGENFYEPAMAKQMGLEKEAFDAAMEELKKAGLINYEKGVYVEIVANEKLGSGSLYENTFAGYIKNNDISNETIAEFKDVVAQINKEFFAGRMSNRWYNFAEKCLREYEFVPETIYLLFGSCEKFKNKNTTGYDAYVNKVAENWHSENIKTPDDVERRAREWEQNGEYVHYVEKKLCFSRPFTDAERKTILSWLQSGVTEEMLSLILDDTNRVSAITIAKINDEIRLWKEAGVDNYDGAKKFAEEKKAKAAEKKQNKQQPKQPQQTGTQVHFDNERKYSDDELDALMNRDRRNGGGGK